jgi:tetratricopeptide (TPR) repeat protein
MNKKFSNLIFFLTAYFISLILFESCASQKQQINTIASTLSSTTLMSLEEALDAVVLNIEAKVSTGSEIVVYKIAASHDEIGDYIAEDLNDRFSIRGSLIPLAREKALQYSDTEHQLQMSGIISDESAVGIGHYLGAKVVITGTFNSFADFSRLRIRAIDIKTSALLTSFSAKINNNDTVIVNITAPLSQIYSPRITEDALAYLNRGKDFYYEDRYNDAMTEFNKALAINEDLAEVYVFRGFIYMATLNWDFDRQKHEFDRALHLDPYNYIAYFGRGSTYLFMREYEKAITDYTQAIKLNPNYFNAYYYRASALLQIGDKNSAINDLRSILMIWPNHPSASEALEGLLTN